MSDEAATCMAGLGIIAGGACFVIFAKQRKALARYIVGMILGRWKR